MLLGLRLLALMWQGRMSLYRARCATVGWNRLVDPKERHNERYCCIVASEKEGQNPLLLTVVRRRDGKNESQKGFESLNPNSIPNVV